MGESRGHSSSVRRKLDLDLDEPSVLSDVGTDQIEYYRQRAPWFDDCYTCQGDYDLGPERNAQWRAEIDRIEAALSTAGLSGDCVELGSGTGFWTERLAPMVDQVWAIDAASEMLEIAQRRGYHGNVEFVLADLWDWKPAQQWDSAAAFFFIEHVPDSVLPALLTTLHRALRPGAAFFIAEGAWTEPLPLVETRAIGGYEFRVVERRRSHEEFETVFDRAGFSVEIGDGSWFTNLVATRR